MPLRLARWSRRATASIAPVAAFAAALLAPATRAQDLPPIDESALFGDSAAIVDTSTAPTSSGAASPSPLGPVSGASLGLSGEIQGVAQGALLRDDAPDFGQGDGSGSMVGAFYLDARLPGEDRAYAAAEVVYDGARDTADYFLREMFVDFNVGRRFWLRGGKQVLHWGTGMLWTPTDLVNPEREQLVDRPGAREGAFGLRALIPFGTRANLYAFLDLGRVRSADSLALATRAELTAGTAEIALSSWFRQDRPGVLGLDATAGLKGWDLHGAVLLASGDLEDRLVVRDGKWALRRDKDRGQVKASVGLGKAFRIGDLPDRLRLDAEGFYQSAGYGRSIYSKARAYEDTLLPPFLQELPPDSRNVLVGSGLFPLQQSSMDGTGATYLLTNGLLRTNEMGRWYVAGSASFSRFLVQDVTLLTQTVANLGDRSGTSTLGLQWQGLHGVWVMATLYRFWGDKDREYTFSGREWGGDARLGVRF